MHKDRSLMVLVGIIISIFVASCCLIIGTDSVARSTYAVQGPTIRDKCPTYKESENNDYSYYLMNDMICVEMHQVRNDNFNGWWYAYVVGTQAEAVFKSRHDMESWAYSQPYVRRKIQVR